MQVPLIYGTGLETPRNTHPMPYSLRDLGVRPALNSFTDTFCNIKVRLVTAFLSVNGGGGERTRLRRDGGIPSVTSEISRSLVKFDEKNEQKNEQY